MSGQGAVGFTGMRQFGTAGRKQNPYGGYARTGYSTAIGGKVKIDPSIRAIQDRGLGNINELYGQTGAYGDELIGNTRSLRNRFLGNQSDYAESQMNPLRQQIATRRGEVQRSIGNRGLGGSSFGEQSITSFDTESQRALQDASANVEMQQLQALTGIDAQLTQQMFGKISTQAQLNGESQAIVQARLKQELSALGLGQAQQEVMMKAFEEWQAREIAASPHDKGWSGSGGGGMGSSGGSPSAGSCFVAEVLYGIGVEKTLTIRAYVGKHAKDRSILGSFFRLYIKYGRKWADTIEAIGILRPLARMMWDKFHRMAIAEKNNGRS